MIDKPPAEFDWVQARFNCSVPEVFKKLRSDAENDVARINALNAKEAIPTTFEVANHDSTFSVIRRDKGDPSEKIVRFTLLSNEIVIAENAKKEALAITIGLNNNGECTLRLKEQELYRWQLLRIALEELFFTR